MTHYAVLNVPPAATEGDIKKAYRDLARIHHPDVEGGNSDRYAQIATAYEIVGDEVNRRQYDAYLRLTHKVCPKCQGSGVRWKQQGFLARIAIPCEECNQVGYV